VAYYVHIVSTQTGTQAIDRAAEILVRVVDRDEPWRVGELADATGLPRSTTSRLVRALERHGLVQREATGGALRAGPVLLRFAQSSAGGLDLVGLADEHLRRLADESGESVNLAVPTGGGVEQVAQVDSRYLLGATNWVGRRVPYHASALGKVFLAYGAAVLPSGALAALTPQTITDRAQLRDELARVRERGFATTVDELEPGLVALAAPVFGADGTVVAGISVSGPAARLSPAVRDVAPLVMREAADLSVRLGHRHREGAG
jgi:IclR family acetate operon transcriptional repressor